MNRLPERPLGLPFPDNQRLAALCRDFLRKPVARVEIDEWAAAMGISRRSFTRLFRRELGVSFVTWRQQACIFASLPRLAAGEAVTNVALDAGYENIPAFTTMFRRMLGSSPRAYRQAARQRSAAFSDLEDIGTRLNAPHPCACHRDPASPSLWAERTLPAAQTRVGWIPVTSTGMRGWRWDASAPCRLLTVTAALEIP